MRCLFSRGSKSNLTYNLWQVETMCLPYMWCSFLPGTRWIGTFKLKLFFSYQRWMRHLHGVLCKCFEVQIKIDKQRQQSYISELRPEGDAGDDDYWLSSTTTITSIHLFDKIKYINTFFNIWYIQYYKKYDFDCLNKTNSYK